MTEVDIDFVVGPARVAYPAILAHMEHDAPLEAVGWLWSDGTTTRFINQARSATRFAVGMTQMAEALGSLDESDEKQLVGLYHSHPNGSHFLSDYDVSQIKRQWQEGIEIPWLVITPDHLLHVSWWMPETDSVFSLRVQRYSEVLSAV